MVGRRGRGKASAAAAEFASRVARLPVIDREKELELARRLHEGRLALASTLLASDRGVEWMLERKSCLSGGSTHPDFGDAAVCGSRAPDSNGTDLVAPSDRKASRSLVGRAEELFSRYRSLRLRSACEHLKRSSRERYAMDAGRFRRRAVELLLHLVYPVQMFDELLDELETLARRAAPLLARLRTLPECSGVPNERLDSTLRSLARRRCRRPGEPDLHKVRQATAEYRDIQARLAAIREAAGRPLETLSDELERAREGRANAMEARDLLTEANLRLVLREVRALNDSRMPESELQQEGFIGLVHGAEKFDFRRGLRFSTCATWWITQRMRRAASTYDRLLHIPQRGQQLFRRVLAERRAWLLACGREPTQEELQQRLGCEPRKLVAAIEAMRDPVSLQESPVGDATSLADIVPDADAVTPVAGASRRELLRKARSAMDTLSDRERKVLLMRFGLFPDQEAPLGQVTVSSEVTAERIRQIEARAVLHMTRRRKKNCPSRE